MKNESFLKSDFKFLGAKKFIKGGGIRIFFFKLK